MEKTVLNATTQRPRGALELEFTVKVQYLVLQRRELLTSLNDI